MPRRPPERLPAGFRSIWQALDDADESSSSRAELARRLGVSTHTIQRILVDGDVPDFPAKRSTRLNRSWARTLTRLALHLHREPRAWIEAAGIPWDESIRQVAELTARKLLEQAPVHDTGVRPGARIVDRIRREVERGRRDPVEVGYVDLRPFSDPLPGESFSFFHDYIRRLVAALDPAWEIRIRVASSAHLAEELAAPDTPVFIGAGLFDSVHLRARGFEFLPLPGWQIRLGALCVTRAAAPETVPAWRDVVAAPPPGRACCFVPEAEPAWSYLRGQCGWPAERLLVRRRPTPELLAEDLFSEMTRESERPLALVADEATCRRVGEHLSRLDGFAGAFRAREVVATPGDRPRYQLSLAVSAKQEEWRALLDRAWRQELFGASFARTARLYAAVLAAGSLDLAPPASRGDRGVPSYVRPVHFTEARPPFQRELCQHLLALLAERAGDADRSLDLARLLVPDEWHDVLLQEAVHAGATGVAAAAGSAPAAEPSFCESCSTSLVQFPGPSPRYCRYCSDEKGRLRPRDEVHELIAEWMRSWQEGISRDESLERAARFMSTMPAWAKN